jgi:hypothetical protein
LRSDAYYFAPASPSHCLPRKEPGHQPLVAGQGQTKLEQDAGTSPALLNGFARAVDFVNWQVQQDTLRLPGRA